MDDSNAKRKPKHPSRWAKKHADAIHRLRKWIGEQGSLAKLRPDMKIVVMRNWEATEERLRGARHLLAQLVQLAKTV